MIGNYTGHPSSYNYEPAIEPFTKSIPFRVDEVGYLGPDLDEPNHTGMEIWSQLGRSEGPLVQGHVSLYRPSQGYCSYKGSCTNQLAASIRDTALT
jgi:hypothetical protein